MKTVYFILLGFFYFSFTFSQTNDLSETWFLQTVRLDNEVYERPESIESISDTYFSLIGNPIMLTQTCEMYGGIIGNFEIDEDEQNITFLSCSFFEGGCTETETIQFIESLFTFYETQLNNPLSYEITTETDGSKILKISDGEGNFVEYIDHLRYAPQEILENDWYLTELNLDGISYDIPENEEIPYVEVEFDNGRFYSSVCENNLTSLVDFNETDSQIYLYDLVTTDVWCTLDSYNETFRLKYYQFYFPHYIEPFSYQVTNNSDGSKSLQITSFDGDFVIYNNSQLSINENFKSNISIYPNPVKDKLTIQNPDLKITSIKLSDASGKIILKQKISGKESQIDLRALPSGVYFIILEENGKTLKTEKIIKK